MSAPPASDEGARLEALYRYRVLDTPAESALDELTRLAAQVCGAPIAVISLVDRDRQWFKARVGLDVTETPRRFAFCAHTILGPDLMVVPDARDDTRFADNPMVAGEPRVRFYAGAPLLSPEGHALGALGVIDLRARTLQADQATALRTLSRAVMAQLDARRLMEDVGATLADLERAESALRTSEEAFRSLVQKLPTGVIIQDAAAEIQFANGMALELLGLAWDQIRGKTSFDPSWNVIHDDGSPFPGETHPVVVALATGRPVHGVIMGVYRPATNDRVWLLVNADPEVDEDGRIRQVLCAFTDVTERRLASQRLEQSEQRYRQLSEERGKLALTDPLTGIANRRAGEEVLAREAARAQRYQTPLSVALFDLDYFKSINDRFGHAAGDRALQEIARLLTTAARGCDHLVRWGGEEFLAVLPGETLEGARSLAERARQSVSGALLGGLPRITLSSGVAELGAAETPAEVLARADAALYAAKSCGRNLVR